MEAVYIVILLALLEYQAFGGLVARARRRYGVKAPAITGQPDFERTFRVHQNTLESLVVFVPAVWIFGLYVSAFWAATLGIVFVVARVVYAAGYIRAAEKRGLGAGVSGVAMGILVLGGLVGLGLRLVH
jgi:glutathione S-transferase